MRTNQDKCYAASLVGSIFPAVNRATLDADIAGPEGLFHAIVEAAINVNTTHCKGTVGVHHYCLPYNLALGNDAKVKRFCAVEELQDVSTISRHLWTLLM